MSECVEDYVRKEVMAYLLQAIIVALVVGFVLPARGEQQDEEEDRVYRLRDVLVHEERQIVEGPSASVRLTSEDIQALGAKNASEAVQYATGVLPTTGSRNQTDTMIRGLTQNRSVVLIDGVPVTAPFRGDFDLSQLASDNIEEIKVIKDAPSVVYGPDAMAGVISITTKRGEGVPGAKVNYEFSDNDTHHVSAQGFGKYKDVSGYLFGSYQGSDGWDVSDAYAGTQYQESGGLRLNSDYQRWSGQVKLGYDNGKDTSVYVSYIRINNSSGIPPSDNPDIVRPFFWQWDKWQENILSLSEGLRFSDDTLLTLVLYHHDHEDALDMYPDEQYKDPSEISVFKDSSLGGNLLFVYSVSPELGLLRLGSTFSETEHEQQSNTLVNDPWDEFNYITYSFYAEGEIRPTSWSTIVPGISYEKRDYRKAAGAYAATGKLAHPEWPGRPFESKDEDALNPQLTVYLEPFDYLSLSAKIAHKTRFPNLQELYSDTGGNFQLSPEKMLSYDLGGYYMLPKNKGYASCALFIESIEDYIYRINNRSMFRNISQVKIQGTEVGLSLVPFKGTTCSVGWLYLWKAEDEEHDVDLPETPKHKINFSVGHEFDFGLGVRVFGLYGGMRPVYDNRYNQIGELDDFTVVNLRISQDVGRLFSRVSLLRFFELSLSVYNITDENYYSEPAFPAPGRSLWGGITMRI